MARLPNLGTLLRIHLEYLEKLLEGIYSGRAPGKATRRGVFR